MDAFWDITCRPPASLSSFAGNRYRKCVRPVFLTAYWVFGRTNTCANQFDISTIILPSFRVVGDALTIRGADASSACAMFQLQKETSRVNGCFDRRAVGQSGLKGTANAVFVRQDSYSIGGEGTIA